MTVPNAEGKGVEPSGITLARTSKPVCRHGATLHWCALTTATVKVRARDVFASNDYIPERVRGIEPRPFAWKAFVLPLNYTRIDQDAGAMTISAF